MSGELSAGDVPSGSKYLMDVHEIIRQLYEERERVDHAIRSLEELLAKEASGDTARKRRGRKSMSQEERRQVSKRMRKYWEDRRKK